MADDTKEILGKWTVWVKDWVWEYEFLPGWRVLWRDTRSNEKGEGRWSPSAKLINVSWIGSSTIESWHRPIKPSNQKGWYQSSYYVGEYTMQKVLASSAGPPARLSRDLQDMAHGSDFEWGKNFGRVRDRINAASAQEKQVALADQALLGLLRIKMDFNDFAMAVELLGRQAPTGKELSENSVVKNACDAAWKDSNVDAINPNDWRENGGYIFMNLVSGEISTSRVPPGNWGKAIIADPALKDIPANTIVVAIFHTHPNPNAPQECEEHDNQKSQLDGVPDVVRGPKGTFPCGVELRLHLAGTRGYPGPSGGDPPQ